MRVKTIYMEHTDTTIMEYNGRTLTLAGEYDGGEAWIDGKHWGWERDTAAGTVVFMDDEDIMVFPDTDAGWDQFVKGLFPVREVAA